MTEDEALKLALEALQFDGFMPEDLTHRSLHAKAITAIKQARSAPVQETRCAVIVEVFGKDWRLDYMSLPVGKHKLYTQQYVYTTPTAAPDLQAELDATNRQVEILSDALAESRREVAALKAKCPPCNEDCDQGRNCPARKDK
jgi:hypothetical protein